MGPSVVDDMGCGVGNVIGQGAKFVGSPRVGLSSNAGSNQRVDSGTHLVVEEEAHDGYVNLKRGGTKIQATESHLKKFCEESLALVFGHGVAESDGARKKKKYSPKMRKGTPELGGEVESDSIEVS